MTSETSSTPECTSDCSRSVMQDHQPALGHNFENRTSDRDPPLRVLQSFGRPRSTTNPYIVMLKESLDQHREVELLTFKWRRALTEDFDVFHAHWPEILVGGRKPIKKAVRQVLFLVMLIRFRVRGTTIVRTRHNLELPEGISRREIALLKLFERCTTLLIRLNTHTEIRERPFVTIVHGHYRDWFADYPRNERQPGRFAYFGLIRRYKAVDTLLAAFRELPTDGEPVSLYVGGQPSTEELRTEVAGLAAGDARIEAHLEFLSDAELVAAATAAELIVLPYREMHNSGSVLTALSLDRPVLVPDNEVNQALAEEVGEGWVNRYEPPLTAERLLDTLHSGRQRPSDATPDLSGRNWNQTADDHVRAYRLAISLSGTGSRRDR
jgi:beta-1,4-mannosyltransferase